MKILHTEWSDDIGGQEKRVLTEAAGLAKRGHYVAIVCRKHAKIRDEALKLGIDVYPLPLRRPYDIISIVRLVRLLKFKGFDIVNTHSGVDSWIGGIAARIANIPVLVRTRHLNIPLKRNFLNFIHYLPDIYITCGENIKDNLVKQCGFPPEKVVSIPTGVSSNFFNIKRVSDAKVKYGLDMDAVVVTNVGILRKVKGHEITLRSVKTVVESFPKARFLIVGDGPRRKALENMANDLGISEYVIFAGYVENISEIYSFADVAILSSWSEGLPQSLLQAMAAGVPVIATKVGGVPEVVIHERTGILIEPGDHQALAKGIINVLNNPDLKQNITQNARNLVIKGYSTTHMLDETEYIYKSLLMR